METQNLDKLWRQRFTERIGGTDFDAGGDYVFTAMLEAEARLRQGNKAGEADSAVIALSVADPTDKLDADALTAGMQYYLRSSDATRYTDLRGARKCAGTIMTADTNEMIAAAIQRRYNVVTEQHGGLTSDWVQYSSGSIKGLLGKYLPAALFEKGGSLIFPSPSYGVIKSPINSAGIQVIDVPLTRSGSCWKFDLAKMAHVIKESRILMQSPAYRRFFMYANVPHNPTGMGYTAIDWRLRIDWAIENDVTLIVDEAYIDLRYNEKLVSVLQVPGWEKCCVVLQSVSKGWNATGLRFGYVIAHPTVIKALRKVMDGKDSGTFAPSIVAGIWCLLHPEITDVTRETYRKRHGALAAGLREVGFDSRMPEAGLCQLTPAPKAAGGAEFASVADCAEWLREKLRISTMAVKADNCSWLRWAVTFRPIPECALETEEAVIGEVTRRLSAAKLVF